MLVLFCTNKTFMKFLTFIVFSLFFYGCSSSQLKTTQSDITLKFNDISLNTDAKTITSQNYHFPPVDVTKEIKQLKDKTYITIETLKCQNGYIFDGSVDIIFYKIFKPQKSKFLKRYSNIYFYTAKIKDKDINLIIFNQNKKQLNFIYPISKKHFNQILEKFSKEKPSPKTSFNYIQTSKKFDISSQFNPKMIILDGIVKRVGGKRAGI